MSLWEKLFGHRTNRAPSGSVPTWALSASAAALTTNLRLTRATDIVVYSVANTNSMLPTFDSNAVLLAERVAFGELREGDIVTYRAPKSAKLIVHRLNQRRGPNWWPVGDGNTSLDSELVTPANFDRRICGILYGAKDATTDN